MLMSNRSVWFITRPERDPKFHADAMIALKEATNNFTIKWAKNREAHKAFEKTLAAHKLKRASTSESGSGGRTWCAMLKTFAYCYQNDEGYIVPTDVGLALINGQDEFKNVSKQIMTLQIPNAYFMEPGFRPKFDEDFAIRPARFLIRLVQQSVLDYYITKEEIAYFALTAQKDSDLEKTTKLILDFRQETEENKQLMRQNIAEKADHRQRSDSGARDYWGAHSDVAHTFMMLCEYTGMVEYERRINPRLFIASKDLNESLKEIQHYEERYPFNNRYKISLERMAVTNGLDITRYKATRMTNIKPARNKEKVTAKVNKALGTKIFTEDPEEIKNILINQFGKRDGIKYFNELSLDNKTWNKIPSEFVDAYLSNDMNDREFEKQTVSVLRQLGFDEVIFQPKLSNITTEIEIIVRYGNKFGIIDAKYYKEKFGLGQNLASYMANEYIRNYYGYNGWELDFYGYVTAERFTGEGKLPKITEIAAKNGHPGIEGFLVERKTLLAFLDYCLVNDLSKEKRLEIFLKNINNKGIHKFEA